MITEFLAQHHYHVGQIILKTVPVMCPFQYLHTITITKHAPDPFLTGYPALSLTLAYPCDDPNIEAEDIIIANIQEADSNKSAYHLTIKDTYMNFFGKLVYYGILDIAKEPVA